MKIPILRIAIVLLFFTCASSKSDTSYSAVASFHYDNPYGHTEDSFIDLCDQIPQEPLPTWRLWLHKAAGAVIISYYSVQKYVKHLMAYGILRKKQKRKIIKNHA